MLEGSNAGVHMLAADQGLCAGKWAHASPEEVQAEKDKGTPYCIRYHVPQSKDITIQDRIRGDITFNTDSLGDFVIVRSNGLPVYVRPGPMSRLV